jgi:DNA polymerase IV
MGPLILCVDLDQFIAAVEVRRRPELAGLPVAVGGSGDPSRRGVVATATYEARAFGVGSGTPLRTARRRCPHAIFLPLDRPAYEQASAEVMSVLAEFPWILEVAGWDEAFLAIGCVDPEAAARAVQDRLLRRTGLSCSVGIGANKLQAKLASGFAKPAGISRLDHANWAETMNDAPPDALWGIGRKRARRLAELGIGTVVALAESDEETLVSAFGPATGPWLKRLAGGHDDSRVSAESRSPRSRGVEKTFDQDLEESAELHDHVRGLARTVAEALVANDLRAQRIVVKVRYAPFTTQTRGVQLVAPSNAVEELQSAALTALARFDRDRPVRLLGVRAEIAPDPRLAGQDEKSKRRVDRPGASH